VYVIGRDKKVYAWGCYVRESEEKTLYKPTHIPYFDDYTIHAFSTSQKATVALASHKDTPEKRVVVCGKFAPLWNENSSKSLTLPNELNIVHL
jgi:hypothetical protein